MMKPLIRTTLIVTAALLASNGYSAQSEPALGIAEKMWKETTIKGEKRTAQQIFNQDIQAKLPSNVNIEGLTTAIVKIIKKMPILGFGGMDTKNQDRIKRALNFIDYSRALNEDDKRIYSLSTPKIDNGVTIYKEKTATLEDLKELPNDKKLTRDIKGVLRETIEGIV